MARIYARDAVDRSRADELEIGRLLAHLQAASRRAPETWRAAAVGLRAAIERHLRRARERVFPAAVRLVTGAELQELFFEAERRKSHQSLTDSLIFPADRFGIE